nr:hypothetical protein [Streptomyces sp. ok210]
MTSPTKSFTLSPTPDRFRIGETAKLAADGRRWSAAALSFAVSATASPAGASSPRRARAVTSGP